MRWLPTLRGGIEAKDATTRSAQAARYLVGSGLPYRTNWSVERAVAEGFERVTWVYKAVDAISSRASSLPIGIREDDPMDGPWQDPMDRYVNRVLNRRSNPSEVARFLRYRASSQFLLSKKGVFVEVVLNRGKRVAELHLCPVDRTNIVPADSSERSRLGYQQAWQTGGAPQALRTSDKLIAGFEVEHLDGHKDYLPPFDPENPETNSVIWIRKPHPVDPFLSNTPLEAMGIAVDTAFYSRLFNRNFMQNDGRPGGILAINGHVDPEDASELKGRFGGGAHRAGRVTVLEADAVNFVDTAIAPRDAQYVESNGLTKEEILIGFGTPESVLGNASGRTFDNADAEEEIFWRNTMLDHLAFMEAGWDQLTEQGDWDDLYVKHDVRSVSVLQRDERVREDRLAADFDRGAITLNEYLDGTGREKVQATGADVRWITPGRVPIGESSEIEALAKLPKIGEGQPADPAAEARRGAEQGAREGDRLAENRRASFRLMQGGKDFHLSRSMVEAHGGDVSKALEAAAESGAFDAAAVKAAAAGDYDDGIMVCLRPSEEFAKAVAVDGGVAPDELHVTLAYLGKVDEGPNDDGLLEEVEQAVRGFAGEAAPLKGEIAGLGTFSDTGDGKPTILLVDVPGLNGWREALVRSLARVGAEVAENHGYTPHMTLGYDLGGEALVDAEGEALLFDSVWLVWGDEWTEFPLTGGFDGLVNKSLKHRARDADSDLRVHEGTAGEHAASALSAPDVDAPDAPDAGVGKASLRVATDEDRKRLAIPPAWTDVRISDDPSSPLQVVGKDAKGREQRRYSAEHTAHQAAVKFARIKALHEVLPSLDAALEDDDSDDAAALSLIRGLGLRPGSRKNTGAEKQAYGATTLEARHVVAEGDGVRLRFTGKKGVEIDVPVTDPRLAAMLVARAEGREDDAPLFATDERKVGAYLKSKVGPEFLVKDLRTYKANDLALEAMEGMEPPRSKKEFASARKRVGETVSKVLGNTPAMALSAYINPAVFGAWEAGLS